MLRRFATLGLLVVAIPAFAGPGTPAGAQQGVAGGASTQAAGPGQAEVPGTDCTVLPQNNIWNTDISRLPVHAKNKAWKRTMDASNTLLHPDFGPPNYGMPFKVVGNAHRDVRVRFDYADESDEGPYPFGPDIPIEGGSDRHALMINRDTCVLYELFAAFWNDGDPHAGS